MTARKAEGNWASAENFFEDTKQAIAEEVSRGFIEAIPGGLEAARRRWAQVSVGRLGLVKVAGKRARLKHLQRQRQMRDA